MNALGFVVVAGVNSMEKQFIASQVCLLEIQARFSKRYHI